MILFLYIYLAKQIAIETVDAGGVLCSLDVNRVQQKIDQFANVKKFEVGETTGMVGAGVKLFREVICLHIPLMLFSRFSLKLQSWGDQGILLNLLIV